MIGYLSGTVRGTLRDTVVIETNGVGYRVHTRPDTLMRAHEGEPLTLWTYLAVRENAHQLFGFETKEELAWFELLLTVSGVGPRSALAILNHSDIETLRSAIAQNNSDILSSVVGIGKKTASKIVLELKEKVDVTEEDVSQGSGTHGEVVEALISLGYSTKEARDAVRAIPKELETTEDRVREAIKIASR